MFPTNHNIQLQLNKMEFWNIAMYFIRSNADVASICGCREKTGRRLRLDTIHLLWPFHCVHFGGVTLRVRMGVDKDEHESAFYVDMPARQWGQHSLDYFLVYRFELVYRFDICTVAEAGWNMVTAQRYHVVQM